MSDIEAPLAQTTTLEKCPPGPFVFSGHLGFKTEYRMTLPEGPTNIPGDQIRWKISQYPDAYCIDSGEIFWGGARTHAARSMLMVEPVVVVQVTDALRAVLTSDPIRWSDFGHFECPHCDCNCATGAHQVDCAWLKAKALLEPQS